MKFKEMTLACTFLGTSMILYAQSYVPSQQDIMTFFTTRTRVVLEDNPLSEFNSIIRTVMQQEWKVTEFDFVTDEEFEKQATSLFGKLSSGHKIVLLTITRLVETVEERSLVLLDEPEAHLHPPLLSAFIRALSDLLINRNGVAIIATHSPVVLQEVPLSCAWKLRRNGYEAVAERPEVETFGENVGVLTREVFGLEVPQSGFHKLLQEAVEHAENFEAVLESFDHQLGAEARAIARGLIAARAMENGGLML